MDLMGEFADIIDQSYLWSSLSLIFIMTWTFITILLLHISRNKPSLGVFSFRLVYLLLSSIFLNTSFIIMLSFLFLLFFF